MMEGKICLIKMNIPAGNNLVSEKVIDPISLLSMRVTKKNTWSPARGKLISIVFGSGNETKGAKSFEMRIRGRMTIKKFIGCFVMKDRRRHSIDEVGGCKERFSPKLDRDFGLKREGPGCLK